MFMVVIVREIRAVKETFLNLSKIILRVWGFAIGLVPPIKLVLIKR